MAAGLRLQRVTAHRRSSITVVLLTSLLVRLQDENIAASSSPAAPCQDRA